MVGLNKFIPESERPVKFEIHDFDSEESFGDLKTLLEENSTGKTKRTKK